MHDIERLIEGMPVVCFPARKKYFCPFALPTMEYTKEGVLEEALITDLACDATKANGSGYLEITEGYINGCPVILTAIRL